MATWDEFKKTKNYPDLPADAVADVLIVGGGITGIINAYTLAKAGKKVVLLEEKEVGSGATLATTAFITKAIDSELSEVSSIFSKEDAKNVWESGQAAIEEFDKIIKEESIDCEFMRCSNYLIAMEPSQMETLRKEFASYVDFGFPASIQKDGDSLGFKNLGHVEIPDQAKFHVAKFLYALMEKAAERGVLIYENTKVANLREEKGKVVAETEKGYTVTADDAIIATYKPLTDKSTHLKKAMYVSYVYEVEVPWDAFQEGLYEDLGNPYHYFRIDKGREHDRMIIGGEDHKDIFGKTLSDDSFEALQEFLKKIMEGRPYKISKKWHGPILEPSDGLPLIGEIAPHTYVATAFSGNGMTYSMISSMIFRDLLSGKKNSWAETYSPRRTLLHPKRLAVKAADYIEEFWGGALKNLLS